MVAVEEVAAGQGDAAHIRAPEQRAQSVGLFGAADAEDRRPVDLRRLVRARVGGAAIAEAGRISMEEGRLPRNYEHDRGNLVTQRGRKVDQPDADDVRAEGLAYQDHLLGFGAGERRLDGPGDERIDVRPALG